MFSIRLKYTKSGWVWVLLVMAAQGLHAQGADSLRFVLSFTVGASWPMAAFSQSRPEQFVQWLPADPNPPVPGLRNYDRKGGGTALPGNTMSLNFSYRLATNWRVLADVGSTRHQVDTAPAENYLENILPTRFSEVRVTAADYRCISITTSIAYRHALGPGWLQAGPVVGLAVLAYPDYTVSFQESFLPIRTNFTHWGAEPNLTGLLFGGFGEFVLPWRIVAKKSRQTVAQMEIGMKLSYVATNFTYYATAGTAPEVSEYYKDQINHRVLQPTLRLGIKL